MELNEWNLEMLETVNSLRVELQSYKIDNERLIRMQEYLWKLNALTLHDLSNKRNNEPPGQDYNNTNQGNPINPTI